MKKILMILVLAPLLMAQGVNGYWFKGAPKQELFKVFGYSAGIFTSTYTVPSSAGTLPYYIGYDGTTNRTYSVSSASNGHPSAFAKTLASSTTAGGFIVPDQGNGTGLNPFFVAGTTGTVTVSFYYRANAVFAFQHRDAAGNLVASVNIPVNTGNAVFYTVNFAYTNGYSFRIRQGSASNGDYFEISALSAK